MCTSGKKKKLTSVSNFNTTKYFSNLKKKPNSSSTKIVLIYYLICILCTQEHNSYSLHPFNPEGSYQCMHRQVCLRGKQKVLLDLRVCPTSCLWWCDCEGFEAVVGGPAWLRTRRPRTPTSPQTRRSLAAARWRLRTARWSPSRRGGSPQMHSTSRSTSCPSLQ